MWFGCRREGGGRWICFLVLWVGCLRGFSGNVYRL